jgi:hypothetical protein
MHAKDSAKRMIPQSTFLSQQFYGGSGGWAMKTCRQNRDLIIRPWMATQANHSIINPA